MLAACTAVGGAEAHPLGKAQACAVDGTRLLCISDKGIVVIVEDGGIMLPGSDT